MSVKIFNYIIGNRIPYVFSRSASTNCATEIYMYVCFRKWIQLRKIRQHSRYHDRDSKWAPADYKSEE